MPDDPENSLIGEIIRLSAEAIELHGKMSGLALTPETFIRDWVAAKLYCQRHLRVAIEADRDCVVQQILGEEQREAHDALELGRYKLDMIVRDGDRLRAIIEFKQRGLIGAFANDLRRTMRLLALASRQVEGYGVFCAICGAEQEILGVRDCIKALPNDLRQDPVYILGPKPILNSWYGIIAVRAS